MNPLIDAVVSLESVIMLKSFIRGFQIASFCLLILRAEMASACLNDRNVDRAEKEFRSRYENPTLEERTEPKTYSLAGISGLLAGCALVAGTVRIEFRRSGKK